MTALIHKLRPDDKDAAEIGDLYRKARRSLIGSVQFAIECGQRLTTKKKSLGHGEWLPWLEANADTLGFDNRKTASRLMKLAKDYGSPNGALAPHLNDANVLQISRQIWGHAEAIPDLEKQRTERHKVTAELGVRKLGIASITEVDLASDSVDAVITDPPYAEASVPLYGKLADLAMRVLKPSGWCLVMVGDLYLAKVLRLMTDAGLIDRGYVAMSFNGGPHSRIGATKTFQAIKLILMLQKPPTRQPPEWGPNLLKVEVKDYDKSLHDWQQNQPLFEKLVERFTKKNDLVVDPFAGSGTTIRAALSLGRKGWGSDIEGA
jgi:hypothetical protein